MTTLRLRPHCFRTCCLSRALPQTADLSILHANSCPTGWLQTTRRAHVRCVVRRSSPESISASAVTSVIHFPGHPAMPAVNERQLPVFPVAAKRLEIVHAARGDSSSLDRGQIALALLGQLTFVQSPSACDCRTSSAEAGSRGWPSITEPLNRRVESGFPVVEICQVLSFDGILRPGLSRRTADIKAAAAERSRQDAEYEMSGSSIPSRK
jgi:hypothetical protein